MAGFPANRLALLVLFCLFALPGCKDAEKERALADAKAANTALAELKTQLGDVKVKLAAATEARDKLQAAADEAATLKNQVAQLTQERDAALAKAAEAQNMVEKLNRQLQDQIQKVTALQEQNAKLQQAIDQLNKIVSAIKPPEAPPQQ